MKNKIVIVVQDGVVEYHGDNEIDVLVIDLDDLRLRGASISEPELTKYQELIPKHVLDEIDDIAEEVRRDEKHGLYLDRDDIAN